MGIVPCWNTMLGDLTMANMRLNIMSGWLFDGTMQVMITP
jgi:hypothetical protein